MSYAIGILDQSIVIDNETAREALQQSIQLAKKSEQLGYKRFWVAEHHNMSQVAGVSPEVLIGHLLAKTEKIHIGSGGVMLQHYSPYKVAENFHLLENLAPGRVDVGIGKAPGGLQLSTEALQYGTANDGIDFEERMTLLKKFLQQSIPEDHPLYGVQATPLPENPLDLFLLGGSENSAKLATSLHAHYVYARFLNNSDEVLEKIASWHAQNNTGTKLIVAIAVLAAETEERAKQLAQDIKLYHITFADGRTLAVQSHKQVEDLREQTSEAFTVNEKQVAVVSGTAASIKEKLDAMHEQYKIDEFIFHTPLQNRQARNDSYERLGKIYQKEQISIG